MILLESRRRALKPGKHWLSAISYDGHMVIGTYHGVFFCATRFFSPESEEKRGEEIRDVIRLPCPGALELPNEDQRDRQVKLTHDFSMKLPGTQVTSHTLIL